MPTLPTGTVTFLYTDIEGSTRLLQAIEERYTDVVAQQRRHIIDNVQAHTGVVVDAVGDTVFAVFAQAKDAAGAAMDVQRSMTAHPWPPDGRVRVRMGLHTGEPHRVEAGYVGIDVHRAARICAAGHGGQILLSRTTHELIAHDLPPGVTMRNLGQHRLKDLARPLHLYQLVVPDLPSDFPPLRTLSILPNNLPSMLTSFVGRERELADIKERLSRNRLVTLVGVGGCGKTRLALQVAADLFDVYPDGVWLVELTTLTDPALISHTVSAILGLREEPGRPILQILIDYLRSKRLLLVTDNCEHLLRETAGLTHTLLHACPTLHILATSREPLHVKGEVTYRVTSLRVPETSDISVEQLLKYEAAQLFIDRAVPVLPSFTLPPERAKIVATICRRLDGIPLAIELAASRVRALSLEQIAERLDDRFRLLTGRFRVDVPQHQTLQATMDWSHDLLSPREQVALRRLSVFSGGLTLEAAEEVCGSDPLADAEIFDLITYLVDKSLVQYQPEDTRYDLLETVREYAWNKLQEAGEVDKVSARHLAFFVNLSEAAGMRLRTDEAARWLDRIEVEHENLRGALRSSMDGDEVASAARIGGAVWWFWLVRGHWSEGRDWLERILKRIDQATIRAKLLNGAATLAYFQRDVERAHALASEALSFCRSAEDSTGAAYALCLLAEIERARGRYDRAVALGEQSVTLFQAVGDTWGGAFSRLALGFTIERDDRERAVSLLEESLRLFRAVGDPWGILRALVRLGRVARVRGDFARAEALFNECRELAEQLRDNWEIASALVNLGQVARMTGHYNQAQKLLERSLTLFERLGDKDMITYPQEELALLMLYEGNGERATRLLTDAVALSRQPGADKLGLAVCLLRLGFVRQVAGASKEARALIEESLALCRDLHEKIGIASCLSDLGRLSLSEGALQEAARLQQESLILRQEFGSKHGVAECLERMATIAVAQSDHTRAARLLGAADAIRKSIDIPLAPTERFDHAQTVGTARSELGEAAFTTAWSEGLEMTLDHAVDYALAGTR